MLQDIYSRGIESERLKADRRVSRIQNQQQREIQAIQQDARLELLDKDKTIKVPSLVHVCHSSTDA